MTYVHSDRKWKAEPGDAAGVSIDGKREIHVIWTRTRDLVLMECGLQARLRRHWTQSSDLPWASPAGERVTCVGCLPEAP